MPSLLPNTSFKFCSHSRKIRDVLWEHVGLKTRECQDLTLLTIVPYSSTSYSPFLFLTMGPRQRAWRQALLSMDVTLACFLLHMALLTPGNQFLGSQSLSASPPRFIHSMHAIKSTITQATLPYQPKFSPCLHSSSNTLNTGIADPAQSLPIRMETKTSATLLPPNLMEPNLSQL